MIYHHYSNMFLALILNFTRYLSQLFSSQLFIHNYQCHFHQRARVSDSGAYLCQPSVGGPAGAMVHVIRGQNEAEMQKAIGIAQIQI